MKLLQQFYKTGHELVPPGVTPLLALELLHWSEHPPDGTREAGQTYRSNFDATKHTRPSETVSFTRSSVNAASLLTACLTRRQKTCTAGAHS
jgi:hypothetical protein